MSWEFHMNNAWWASFPCPHRPLVKYVKFWVAHAPAMPGMFPRLRGLAIPTCIMAWRACRGACWDHELTVSFEVGGNGYVSGIPRRMRNLQLCISGKRPMNSKLWYSGCSIHICSIHVIFCSNKFVLYCAFGNRLCRHRQNVSKASGYEICVS